MPKPDKNIRLERHSGTGYSIKALPKKQGAGKYAWGKNGLENGPAALDDHDPNFIDDGDEGELTVPTSFGDDVGREDTIDPDEALLEARRAVLSDIRQRAQREGLDLPSEDNDLLKSDTLQRTSSVRQS